MTNLRITYERETDIAYIILNGERPHIEESRICEEMGDPVETILDLDPSGQLTGIEVRNASRRLPERLLLDAEPEPPPK